MHQGLLHLEKRGIERDKQAVSAIRIIEEILSQEDIEVRLEFFENGEYIHSTEDIVAKMQMIWKYETDRSQVKVSLWFKDNPESDLAYSIYIRLDLVQGRWYLGLECDPESGYGSPLGKHKAWSSFKLTRPGVEKWIPEDRIFSEILPAMIQIFNIPPSKLPH